ncbi:MAG: transcription-repair coupling factor [Pseudomonadota bacterium]
MTIQTPNLITISSVPEGFDGQLLARAARDQFVCFIARDAKRMQAVKTALRFFDPDVPIHEFPAWDCLPYDRVSMSVEISAARMSTLATLTQLQEQGVLLTTVNAASQFVPARAFVAQNGFQAKVGRLINEAALRDYVTTMGYHQVPTVREQGDYAIRGGIIDLFAPGAENPVRLDLFGDQLDSLRAFDAGTQRTIAKLTELNLAPASEIVLNPDTIARFRSQYRAAFGAGGQEDPLYEAISAGRTAQGMCHWLPFFYAQLESIFDYLGDATLYWDDQASGAAAARWQNIQDQFEARQNAMAQRTSLDTVYKPIPPDTLYMAPDILTERAASLDQKQFAALAQPTGYGVTNAGAVPARDFAPERQDNATSLFAAMADHIRAEAKTHTVIIASFSAGARERLKGLLAEQDIHATLAESFGAIDARAGVIALVVWPLDQGFKTDTLSVMSEQDVLGERLLRPKRKRRRAENFLSEASSLNLGDLVVHIDHGIGRFQGLETIEAAGAPHECLLLEYANKDRLYLPVENVELLSRYGQETGMLDRLGGGAWQAKKAKLRQRIRDIADKLIRLAAERVLRKGVVMEPPAEGWESFCARFPYSETDDQLNAIEDVLGDLASGRPMDRLICGDVGFGKTEVALRAAFVAASAGTQVAVIAPTTLLARQHLASFSERFRGTGIRVRQLSRFVSAAEAKATKQALKDGTVEIVVGTHALLAKDIAFNALGLLVIDEEQKFGVTHKEALKHLKSEVHVLTLTATPIPRTLQMSLSGVRELSIIATPPVDRLAIRTFVAEFDTVTIREALLREFYRGGQSFIVVPRISDMPQMEEFLREQVPEVSFITAHVQMAAGELDERMNAFYDGAHNVLLATTIVESGLDIPSANTIVIHRADMFGLAQLYQIRGRVGRSKSRAYAFLTTKPKQKLTQTAMKRLRVLGALDSLGAGFMLASQDLDIRGAGNLLGEEQSGQVREVGYELYQDMLEEQIAKLKAGTGEGLVDEGAWSPQISLGVPVMIPADYVPDLDLRLGLYRRLSGLAKKVELEGFAAELIDRFGPLPDEVETLMKVVRIKGLCQAARISKFDSGPKGAVIQFFKDKFADPAGLAGYLSASNGTAKIRDNKLVIRRDWDVPEKRLKGAAVIARDLAKIAIEATRSK